MINQTNVAPDYNFLRAWRECRKGPCIIDPRDGQRVKKGSKKYIDLNQLFEANQRLVSTYCVLCGGAIGNDYCKHCGGNDKYFSPTTKAYAPMVKSASDPQVYRAKIHRTWAAKVNNDVTTKSKVSNLSKSAPTLSAKRRVVISIPTPRRKSQDEGSSSKERRFFGEKSDRVMT